MIEYLNEASVPKEVGITWEFENTVLKHKTGEEKKEKEEKESKTIEKEKEEAVEVTKQVKKMPNIPVRIEKKKGKKPTKGKTVGRQGMERKKRSAPRIVKKVNVKDWIDEAADILGGDE